MSEEKKPEAAPAEATAPKTAEKEADLQERIDGFNKELAPLLGKFELGLGALPKILQDGRIGADPVILSVRGKENQLKQQSKPAEESSEITNPDK